jgi:hypothetical protein
MKLTKRKLIQIIKEEVSACREDQLNEVDPAVVTGLQQAFLLNPRAFRLVWDAIKVLPSIPQRWRDLSAKEAEAKAASQEDPQLAQLLDALGEFSVSTGGEAFSDEERKSMSDVYSGRADASGNTHDIEEENRIHAPSPDRRPRPPTETKKKKKSSQEEDPTDVTNYGKIDEEGMLEEGILTAATGIMIIKFLAAMLGPLAVGGAMAAAAMKFLQWLEKKKIGPYKFMQEGGADTLEALAAEHEAKIEELLGMPKEEFVNQIRTEVWPLMQQQNVFDGGSDDEYDYNE